MMALMRPARLLLPPLAALLLCACDRPPTKEIAGAETALGQARQAGAERYAPERFREADAALRDAQRKLQDKDYRGALSSATEASEKSRAAVQQVTVAKTMARSGAEVARAEVQAALDEVASIREEASAAKVPDTVFDEVAPLVDQAGGVLEAVSKSLTAGDLLEAQKAAAELKARVAPLPGMARVALDQWQAAHPKRGRAVPVRKP